MKLFKGTSSEGSGPFYKITWGKLKIAWYLSRRVWAWNLDRAPYGFWLFLGPLAVVYGPGMMFAKGIRWACVYRKIM